LGERKYFNKRINSINMGVFKGYIYCPECKFRGKPEVVKSGLRFLIEVILFLCLIIPWILYRIFIPPTYQCPKCGNTDFKTIKGGETSRCPFCGGCVMGFDPTCPQCGRKLSAGEKYGQMRVENHRQTTWKNRD
jgi:DNA-directed RNA polymerase subunit RPC12/RpoP